MTRLTDEPEDPNSSLEASSPAAVVDSSQPTIDPVVLDLVNAMQLRGIRFKLPHGRNRLRIEPWSKVTDADRIGLRDHRDAIKSLMRSGLMPDVYERPERQVAVPVPPPPPPPIDLDAVGITLEELPDGRQVYTHALGDDYADQVMSGAIPLATAIEHERRVAQQRDELSCATSVVAFGSTFTRRTP